MKPRFQGRQGWILATACSLLLSGCATLDDDGRTQAISVRTSQADGQPVSDIPCVLSNKLGQWTVRTPAEVTIKRADSPLWVSCASDSWEMAAATEQPPESHLGRSTLQGAKVGLGIGALVGLLAPITIPFVGPMVGLSVVAGGTAGAVYGGVAGTVIDGASGRHYDYAPELVVPLKPRDPKAGANTTAPDAIKPAPAAASASPAP